MATRLIRYRPNYATPPGEVLEAYLAAAGMTKAELAARCGRPMKTISEIIHGKAAITPETALQFERVLGHPASLWQNLETNYRLQLAEQSEDDVLSKSAEWACSFPVKPMQKMGWLEPQSSDADLVKKLLRFFGVGSPTAWNTQFGELSLAYRRSPSFETAPAAVAAWARRGEILAADIDCHPYDKKRFRAVLAEVRKLVVKSLPEVEHDLVALCASAGVAVVFVPELPGTHLSGIARWLSKDKALIQLSLRHKTNDHVWFSFFHEAGHLLMHGKKEIFIDEMNGDGSDMEEEANRFASDFLIPPAELTAFIRARNYGAAAIVSFARRIGTAPGVVVGRLQHDQTIPYSAHNGLKERLDWSEQE